MSRLNDCWLGIKTSFEDILHEMPKVYFLGKLRNISLLSAEFAYSLVKVKRKCQGLMKNVSLKTG